MLSNICFSESYHPTLEQNEEQFKENLQKAIATSIRISQLRIQNLKVMYNGVATFVLGTLLGEIPGISKFCLVRKWFDFIILSPSVFLFVFVLLSFKFVAVGAFLEATV